MTSLFIKEFECPSCGGKISRENPASRSITCGYCGQTSHINAHSLEAAGEQHVLIDYGSFLEIGKRGSWSGKKFTILGRVRFNYEDGFWDEWYLSFDSSEEGYLQEDDGSFVLFTKSDVNLETFQYNHAIVGKSFSIHEAYEDIFVTSKSRATIAGGEGELPFRITPNMKADFVEGLYNGEILSIELYHDEQILYVGLPVTLEELGLVKKQYL